MLPDLFTSKTNVYLREMLRILKQQYHKTPEEIIPKLDNELKRLQKSPHYQDIVS